MEINVETHQETFELRYSNHELLFERHSLDSGEYHSLDDCIIAKSHKPLSKLTIDIKEFRKKISDIAMTYSYCRAVIIYNARIISKNKGYHTERIYLEVKIGIEVFTHLFKDIYSIDTWLSSLYKFNELPLFGENFSAKLLMFSPPAFGYILHEGLGHRLEFDDYCNDIEWESTDRNNFSVFDSPGTEDVHGFTPVGDDGTKGIRVKLLSGDTGEVNFLTKETGNLKLSNFKFHPIIRQRHLEIDMNQESLPPDVDVFINILQVKIGKFIKGTDIVLETSMQTVSIRNILYRLPPLRISLKIEDIRSLNSYGEFELHEPESGCVKGYQKELPISYYVNSAWVNIDKANILIEVV